MRNAVLEPTVRTVTHPFPAEGTPARLDTPPIHAITPTRAASERYEDLLALPTAQLRDHALEELQRETALQAHDRRAAVHQRLAAWLELDAEDARILARVYDEAAATLDPNAARTRYEAERDAILHGFNFDQFTRLADLVPWLKSSFGLALIGFAAHEPADLPHLPDAA